MSPLVDDEGVDGTAGSEAGLLGAEEGQIRAGTLELSEVAGVEVGGREEEPQPALPIVVERTAVQAEVAFRVPTGQASHQDRDQPPSKHRSSLLGRSSLSVYR